MDVNNLPTRYDPASTEDKWYKFWEENNLFAAKVNPAKKPFSIVIPPPNVTGILHMGHALNNTIQDILIRYHRMKGEESLWMPGTDHAGIATQNVVEKAIAKDGLKRQDLGREKFVERVWLWREQYGSTIIHQLKKLGASCDWQRTRFTMDESYSNSVKEVFIKLYEKGLIYQGNYIINWCPRCQTALSDEEAPHREISGNLYYLRYPLKESIVHGSDMNYIVVATTRPETMLGDTAVAVNPKDKRYKKLIGRTLILPLMNREIKIIADSIVDMKFGTGALKVTPAHDPNDYLLGKKHKLDFINVMRPDGRMNENAGEYKDMDRFQAREVILEDLKEKGLLEKVEAHSLSAGHCYRCHTIIEPYLSKQWFVKMKPLAKPAIAAVKKGKIKFYPKRWTKVYLNWMESIQDWCISRQIWWGHRLPVYYCKKCSKIQAPSSKLENEAKNPAACSLQPEANNGVIVSRIKPDKCPKCGSTDIYQDEDVLDTWFSSWLWPFATFYWPFASSKLQAPSSKLESLKPEACSLQQSDLGYFYPTSVLVTAPEIIFFWVARMIMAGLEFMKDIPFRDVYIHGTVRDIEGKKMSKSLGNIIDPLDIIKEYGADALRFSLISITSQGQDVFLSKEKFEQGRNFANKIWNASRFIMMNLDTSLVKTDLCQFFMVQESIKHFPIPLRKSLKVIAEGDFLGQQDLDITNRWILSRFYSVLKEVNKNLDNYKFNEAANALYAFFWHEFCDWYLELIKADIKNQHNQLVMYKVWEKSLRVMHPFMPFITEEIWQLFLGSRSNTKHQTPNTESIMVQPWPHTQENIIDQPTENKMQRIFTLINILRNIRFQLEIPLENTLNFMVFTSRQNKELVASLSKQIEAVSKNHLLDAKTEGEYRRTNNEFNIVSEGTHIVIPLSGVIDREKQKQKIESDIKRVKTEINNKKALLAKTDFVKRAPQEIVEAEKIKLAELSERLKKMEVVRDGFR